MKKILCFIIALLSLFACKDDDYIEADTQIVVEGWIDDNGFPIVILTNSVPIRKNYQSIDSLEKYVVKWAKVTIDDGEQEVVLSGMIDKSYFPGYIYTTTHLRGKVGKRYKLTVSYKNFYAEAETTIPHPCELDSICVFPCSGNDSLYQIITYFTDLPDEENYYNFFTRVKGEKLNWLTSFLGNADDKGCNGKNVSTTLSRGLTVYDGEDYIRYFNLNDTVFIKFAHIDEISYSFWNEYDEMVTLSRNQFFPYTHSINSNIKGGLGYWCGYGATQYNVSIKEYVCP